MTAPPPTAPTPAAPPPAAPTTTAAKASAGSREERRLGWLLCAPAVLVMAAVTAYPVGYAVYLSLQRYDLRFPQHARFVWFDNYAAVLSSPYWWQALWVTVVITVVSVTVELALGLALALVMHRTVLWRGTVRTAVLVPYGIVTVVAAYSWQYAWTPGTGYLAALLPAGSAPLTDHWQAIGLIILAEVWKTTPFMALLLLAGLALVPEETLRAAQVDGAGPAQRLRLVVLPLMKPAILVALLFRTLDAFRVFDDIYVLTGGSDNTGSVSILGYDNLFTALNLGIGSAISVLVFLCVAAIALVFVTVFGAAAPGAGEDGR
ncbi:carbohydrate ABC transporter permease [Kitasatospora sp. NPDC059408]|uniref:carbohydrate ABC transporter permease n=1 Tax=Kitasatospora sp. NPDC059408 TaxID=3346823 RepID=UPI003676BF24